MLLGIGLYVGALAPEIVAGMPMPPLMLTRVLASVSVFVAAPALAVLVISIAELGLRRHRPAAVVAIAAIVLCALLAVANRIVQLEIVVMGSPAPALDLYAAGSLANFVEMFAWDFCLGLAAALAALAIHGAYGVRWMRNWLAVTGALALLGEAFYFAGGLGLAAAALGLAGMGVSVAAWVVGLSAVAAAALRAPAWRRGERSMSPPYRPVTT